METTGGQSAENKGSHIGFGIYLRCRSIVDNNGIRPFTTFRVHQKFSLVVGTSYAECTGFFATGCRDKRIRREYRKRVGIVFTERGFSCYNTYVVHASGKV